MTAPGMNKAISAIMKWTGKEEWSGRSQDRVADHLIPICNDFGVKPAELDEEIGANSLALLVSCALDDFLAREYGADKRNVIDDYLKRRGWKESVPVKRLLRAMRDSVMSLYEVTGVVPGSHLFMKDLIRGGEPLRVENRWASEAAVLWDRLGARVLQVSGRNYLSNGVLAFPMEAAEDLLESLREEAEAGFEETGDDDALRPVDLSNAAPDFTQFWLDSFLTALREPSPHLLNTDGEALLLCKVRFAVPEANLAEVERRLDGLAQLEPDEEEETRSWDWVGEYGDRERRAEPEEAEKDRSVDEIDDEARTVLGLIELRGADLCLSVNSRERADRGRGMLTDLLGELAGPPETDARTIEELLESFDEPAAGAGEEEEEDMPPEDADRVVKTYLDGHYRRSLTEELPFLDGRTPREASESETGRAELVGWLKTLENNEARRARDRGQAPYDFAWMWEVLGVADLRN